jgi:hypothetical protein
MKSLEITIHIIIIKQRMNKNKNKKIKRNPVHNRQEKPSRKRYPSQKIESPERSSGEEDNDILKYYTYNPKLDEYVPILNPIETRARVRSNSNVNVNVNVNVNINNAENTDTETDTESEEDPEPRIPFRKILEPLITPPRKRTPQKLSHPITNSGKRTPLEASIRKPPPVVHKKPPFFDEHN